MQGFMSEEVQYVWSLDFKTTLYTIPRCFQGNLEAAWGIKGSHSGEELILHPPFNLGNSLL
jgi:hypothetical protein